MSRKTQQLGQLAKIARAHADIELRRYAAFRSQADAMRQHVESMKDELADALANPATDQMDQWRMMTALVGYRADQVHRAEAALASMKPSLEAARSAAAKAFGRSEAIVQLQRLTQARDRLEKQRRSG